MLLCMIPALSATANTTTGYDRGYTGSFAGDGKIYAHGLDLCNWQGDAVDFNDIKAAGYSYVLLRCGTTKGKDNLFETYYSQAKAAGLDVGTYYYSYATTSDEAYADATTTLSYIADKKFEYPVYLDYEDSSQLELDSSIQLSVIREYLSTIKNAGYLPGLYSNDHVFTQSWFTDSEIPSTYEGWYVKLTPDGNYESLTEEIGNTYGMLQYSWDHHFTVNGRKYGPYDANVCYKDYPTIVKTYEFNGYTKHSHQWDNGVVTKEVTCTENGELTYSCSGCDETYTEEIITKGHTEVVDEAVAPTCTESGLTEGKHCSACNEVFIAQTTIDATGHSYIGKITTPASCTKTGKKTYTCTNCSDSYTEAITKTAHKTVTTNKKATYFEVGYKNKKVCQNCGKVISKGTSVKKLRLKKPTAKVSGSEKTIKVKYTKVTGASGFQVKYKIGKKTVTKTFNTKKTVTKTISKLTKGTYNVQVRAFVKQGKQTAYSDWNKTVKVKVK